VRHGVGQVDHYALAVADEAALASVRTRLAAAGYPADEIRDRGYFRSFRTTDPHGQTVEIATVEPGFAPGIEGV
jgi:hypothetical protein